MEITLTPEIEQALRDEAERQGTTPEQLALESLRRHFVQPEQGQPAAETPGTLADLLSGFIGVLSSEEQVPGGAHLSEATSDEFVKLLRQKRAEGRL